MVDTWSRLLLDDPLEVFAPPALSEKGAFRRPPPTPDPVSWIGSLVDLDPVATFVAKLTFGVPLSSQSRIEFTNPLTGRGFSLTEPEYLSFLHDEGRASWREQRDEPNVVCLAMGRRAGKTTLSRLFLTYAMRRILAERDPHRQYGLTPSTSIGVLGVTVSRDNADVIGREVDLIVDRTDLARYATHHHQQRAVFEFRTQADLDRYGLRPLSRVHLSLVPEQGAMNHIRGRVTQFALFDDMAHYRHQGELFEAVVPSRTAFVPRYENLALTTPLESKIVCLSTPRDRTGRFFDLYENPGQGGLSLRLPTWEMNRSLSTSYFNDLYQRGGARFHVEFGAAFTSLFGE